MLESMRRTLRMMITFKSMLFLFICIALWKFKDGKIQSKFKYIVNEDLTSCKNNLPIETNLNLCVDYVNKERRDIIIISAR